MIPNFLIAGLVKKSFLIFNKATEGLELQAGTVWAREKERERERERVSERASARESSQCVLN